MNANELRFYSEGLPENLSERLVMIDTLTANNHGHEQSLRALRDALQVELNDINAKLRTDLDTSHALRRRAAELTEALHQIERGVHRDDGVIPELVSLVGKPGLEATLDTLERLRVAREQVVADMSYDPTITRPYRLRPGVGRHVQDGRVYEAGDVIELNGRQARAWKDKFIEVETTSV